MDLIPKLGKLGCFGPFIPNQYGGAEFDQISYIGDTNSDQNIDVLDVVNIIDIILNNSNPNQVEIYLSDYNSDGLVDISDIVAIVNYILS